MDLPEFRLPAPKGGLRRHYADSVSGNWRVTFLFEDSAAAYMDYPNHH